jgi:hypothetical protein
LSLLLQVKREKLSKEKEKKGDGPVFDRSTSCRVCPQIHNISIDVE